MGIGILAFLHLKYNVAYEILSEQCNKPLGMRSGAIKESDIYTSHNHIQSVPCTNKDWGLSDTSNSFWCFRYASTLPYLEVKFVHATVIKGVGIKSGLLNGNLKFTIQHATVYDESDLEMYGVRKDKTEGMMYDLPNVNQVKTIWFNLTKARTSRITFIALDSNYAISWGGFQFEFYGCPYWSYAKPLGMANGMIDDSRLMGYYIHRKNIASASFARLNSYGDGFKYSGSPTQLYPGDRKVWLQVSLKVVKKLVYISIQANDNGFKYFLEYGKDLGNLAQFFDSKENSYIISTSQYLNAMEDATYIFSNPIVAKVMKIYPAVNSYDNPSFKFELFGVPIYSADHQWKLEKPNVFKDVLMFEDLRPSPRITTTDHFSTTSNNRIQPHLRTNELPDDSCLINPKNCKDGLSFSFWTRIHSKANGHGKPLMIKPSHLVQKSGCLSNEIKAISLKEEFSIHLESFNAPRYHKVDSYLWLNMDNRNFSNYYDVYGFVNHPSWFVTSCSIFNSDFELSHAKVLIQTNENANIGKVLEPLLNFNGWNYGYSISLLFKPSVLSDANVTILKNSDIWFYPQMFTGCSNHKSNIINDLSNQNFYPDYQDQVCKNPHTLKLSHSGFVFCNSTITNYVEIDLNHEYFVVSIKVAGLQSSTGMLKKFLLEFSHDNITWEFISDENENKYVFERKSLALKKIEVLPLPYPIYGRYIRVHSIDNEYIGDFPGLRFDIISCILPPEAKPSWMKLNNAPVCFKAKNDEPAKVILSSYFSISYFKLVYKSGSVKCNNGHSSYSKFSCGFTTELGVVVTNNLKKIIAPYLNDVNANRYPYPPFQGDSSEIHLKVDAPRFFQKGEEISVWYLEDLHNSTENDNDGETCIDLYGWGLPHLQYWLVLDGSCPDCLCAYVDIGDRKTLKIGSECNQAFYMTKYNHLVSANYGKCVKVSNNGILKITKNCNSKFQVNESNHLQHKSSGAFVGLLNDQQTEGGPLKMSENATKRFVIRNILYNVADFAADYLITNASNEDITAIREACLNNNADLVSFESKEQFDVINKRLSEWNFTEIPFHIGYNHASKIWFDGAPFDFLEMTKISSEFTYQDVYLHSGHVIVNDMIKKHGLCKKRHGNSSMGFNIPIISTGVHVVDGNVIGNGFLISSNIAGNRLFVALAYEGTVCDGVIAINSSVWMLVSLTFSKSTVLLSVMINSEDAESIPCTNRLPTTDLLQKPQFFLKEISNYLNILSFYDHSYIYIYADIANIIFWQYALEAEQLKKLYDTDAITFSDYPTFPNHEWKIRSSVCSESTLGLCGDVDRLLQRGKEIECNWVHGDPIGKHQEYIGLFNIESECIYECYDNSVHDHSINGVSMRLHFCYCIYDMYNISENAAGQISCYLPVKVKYGVQTQPHAGLRKIQIHPSNKMWYAIGMDNQLYRHPSRKSLNEDLWTKVFPIKFPIDEFHFFKNEIWVQHRNGYIYYWNGQNFVSNSHIGVVRTFCVGETHLLIILASNERYVLKKHAVVGSYHYSSIYQFVVGVIFDQYHDSFVLYTSYYIYQYKIGNQVEYIKYINLNKQVAISSFGTFYWLKTNHAIYSNIGSLDEEIGPLDRLSQVSSFDVDNDQYFVLLDDKGIVHQYPVTSVSVSGIKITFSKDYYGAKNWCENDESNLASVNDEYHAELIKAVALYSEKSWIHLKNTTTKYFPLCTSFINKAFARLAGSCLKTTNAPDHTWLPFICTGKKYKLPLLLASSNLKNYEESIGGTCQISSELKSHNLFIFSLKIKRYAFVKKVNMVFVTDNELIGETMKFQISLMAKSPSLLNCSEPVLTSNLALTYPVYWTFQKWEYTMETPDISKLIQHAINQNWHYQKEVGVLFKSLSQISENLKIKNAYLKVFYEDNEPNNFLYFPPTSMQYMSYSTGSYHTGMQWLSFWYYMSVRNWSNLLVWQINEGNVPKLIFSVTNKQTQNWEQAVVKLDSVSGGRFKVLFHRLQRLNAIKNHVAVDSIELSANKPLKLPVQEELLFNISDMTSYMMVLEKLKLSTPVLLYPFATKMYFNKDYGPYMLNLTSISDVEINVATDKYGFPHHSLQICSKKNLTANIKRATIHIRNEFAIMFHYKSNQSISVNQSIFKLQSEENVNSISFNDVGNSLRIKLDNSESNDRLFDIHLTPYWTYYAFVYSNGNFTFYCNNSIHKTAEMIYVGPFPDTLTVTTSGFISCLQIYSKALTLAELNGLEFCPNRQSMNYHPHICKYGINVAFAEKVCYCYDQTLWHQSESCSNNFASTIYKDSMYVSFDSNAGFDESGQLPITLPDANEYNFNLGIRNYALCMKNHTGNVLLSVNDINCTSSTCATVGFWIFIADVAFDANSVYNIYDFLNLTIAFMTTKQQELILEIKVEGKFCNTLKLTKETWVFFTLIYTVDGISMYVNDQELRICKLSMIPRSSNLSIGPFVCIDEFSVTLNQRLDLYKKVTLGDNNNHVNVVLFYNVSSASFSKEKIFLKWSYEENEFVKDTIEKLLISVTSYYNAIPSRYILGTTIDDLRMEADGLHASGKVLLNYVTRASHVSTMQQNVIFEGRTYSVTNLKITGVSSKGTICNISFLTATEVTVEIFNQDEEGKKFQLGFHALILSQFPVYNISTSKLIQFVEFETYENMSKLYINDLKPFRNHSIKIWPVSHFGYGKSCLINFATPKAVNDIPPSDVFAVNTSHVSLTVEWHKYDDPTGWNSDELKYVIYWKEVTYNETFNISLYEQLFVPNEFVGFSEVKLQSPKFIKVNISDLMPFTNYSILVTTLNDMGLGNFTEVFCRTAEWYPEYIPEITEIHSTNAQATIIFQEIPNNIELYNSWNLEGYNVTLVRGGLNKTVVLSPNETSVVFSGLDCFSIYQLHVVVFNHIGPGPNTTVCFSTQEHAPTLEIEVIIEEVTNISISLSVSGMDINKENGVIISYLVHYKGLNNDKEEREFHKHIEHSGFDLEHWNEMKKVFVNCSLISKQKPKSAQPLNISISNLTPWTFYNLSLSPCNKIGCNNKTTDITFETEPSVPSCSPNISIVSLGSTELLVSWPCMSSCVNGPFVSYHTTLKESDMYKQLSPVFTHNVTRCSTIFTDLRKYWNYTVVAFVENALGYGPKSQAKWSFTDEDEPSGEPTNLSIQPCGSTIICINVSLPLYSLRNGVIRGYVVTYYDHRNLESKTSTFPINTEETVFLKIVNLSKFTDYDLSIAAFTNVGNGPHVTENVRTLEDVPSLGAHNEEVSNVDAFSVHFQWENIPVDAMHGVMRFYFVNCVGMLANQSIHILPALNITFYEHQPLYKAMFSGLFAYTTYNITIQACTTPGCGSESTIQIKTEESMPVGTVQNLHRCHNSTVETLHLKWSDLLPMEKRGIIQNFTLTFIEEEYQWDYDPESMIVSGNQFNISIPNLRNFTTYIVEIVASNRMGKGPSMTKQFLTPENVPSVSPKIIAAYNISSTALKVEFSPIIESTWEGTPLGYYMYYQLAEEDPICVPGQVCHHRNYVICLGDKSDSCEIHNLMLHTNYSICLSGFTNAGPGVLSECLFAVTDTYVDGNWSIWSTWGSCDKSCGLGIQQRFRFCINPMPARGGANCTGDDVESRRCNDFPCPGFYLANRMQDCQSACATLGDEFACSTVIKTKNQTTVFKNAIDINNFSISFNLSCKKNLDEQFFSKEFHPAYSVEDEICVGYKGVPETINCSNTEDFDAKYRRLCYCIDKETMGYTLWSIWSPCTKSCDLGQRKRYRKCLIQTGCDKTEDTNDCNQHSCPLDGQWGAWSAYGKCSTTCGFGRQIRKRLCNSPSPAFFGKFCAGTDIDVMTGCSPNPCPIHGGWSKVSSLSMCTQPCGEAGSKWQKRHCNNPTPMYHGRMCKGAAVRHVPCIQNKKCKRLSVTFLIKLPFVKWQFKYVYLGSKETLELTSNLSNAIENHMANSSVGVSVIEYIQYNELRSGSVNVNFTVFFKGNPFVETLVLQDAFDNIGRIHDIPAQLIQISSPDVPDKPPTCYIESVTSHEIKVYWDAINVTAIDFYAYYVFVRDVSNSHGNWTSYGTRTNWIILEDLKAGHQYGIRLTVSIATGNGIASSEVLVRTLDGRPTMPPSNLTYHRISGHKVYLSWKSISNEHAAGALVGYKVIYTRRDINVSRSVTTSLSQLQSTLVDLKPATWYFVEVAGYTNAGSGPAAYTTFMTLFAAPGIAPPNIQVNDRISSRLLSLSWNPVPKEEENGYLTGYRITYWLSYEGGVEVPMGAKKIVIDLDRFTHSYELNNLSPYSIYTVKLGAFSEEGYGPEATFNAETCKCPQHIYTNYFNLDPYVNFDENDQVHGYLPKFITEALNNICTNCRSYTKPNVYFDRTLTGYPAKKDSESETKQSIGDSAQLNFPLMNKFYYKYYAGTFPYVGLFRVPGSAIITNDIQVRSIGIAGIFKTIASAWTIILVMFLISVICGWCFWYTEQISSHTDISQQESLKGAWQGVWMAFVTMSTVGYGDFVATTSLSKMLMVLWIMTGLLCVSIFTGFITSNLTSNNMHKPIKLYGTTTAVVSGTTEYTHAILRNAKIIDASTPLEILEMVRNNSAEIGLLNKLDCVRYLDDIHKMSLKVAKLITVDSGYGIALSGGLEPLIRDIQSHVLANQAAISAKFESVTIQVNVTVTKSEVFSSEELIGHVKVLGYFFIVLTLLGNIWWLGRRCRNKNKITPRGTLHELGSLHGSVQEFEQKFRTLVVKFDKQHMKEIGDLQCLKSNFVRLMTRNGYFTEEEVSKKMKKRSRRKIQSE